MIPLPDKATCCGLSLLLSLIERVALLEPKLDGLNVTLMLHFPAAAILAPQGVDDASAKSFASDPVMVNPPMVSAELPVLVSVILCGGLVEPVKREPKSRLAGTSLTVPEETVMFAVTDFVESDVAVAVSVTAPPEGTLLGPV